MDIFCTLAQCNSKNIIAHNMAQTRTKFIIIRLLLLWLLLPLSSFGANPSKLDSLLNTHPVSLNGKLDRYLDLTYYYKNRDPNLFCIYLDSSSIFVDSVNKRNQISRYYNVYGHYYYQKEKFDSCLIMYKKSFTYVDTIKEKENSAMIYLNIGRTFSRIDQYDSALFYYHKVIHLFPINNSEKLDKYSELLLASTYNRIGSVNLNIGDYDKSIDYYYKALELYDKHHKKLRGISVLINIGNIYLYHGEYKKALVEYRKGMVILNQNKGKRLSFEASILTNMGACYKALGNLDTAMLYFENALKIRKKIGPTTSVAGIYDNIGSIKKSQGDFDAALTYFQESLTIRKKTKIPRWIASSYGNIGLLYAKQKKSRKAIVYLKKAIDIAEKNSLLEIKLECIHGLSQAYSDLGDYKKALDYFVNYRELNDSIHSLKLEEKLSKYKQKYESEKKDRLIEHLEETKKRTDLEAEKQKITNEKQGLLVKTLSLAAILLLIILFILYRYFKMKRAADHELFEKNEQINHQKTLKLMKDLEMSSIESFVEGQEKERARIAADLHDRLGTLLSTVRLHFNSMEELLNQDKDAKQSYEFAMQLLDKSVGEVRAVSHNLSKGVLTQFGLIAAVENMRDAINSAGKIQMQVMSYDIGTRLEPESEISLFRVIQELITNVIRHSQADEVMVQFSGSNTHLSVMVEDHGIGFDPDNVKSDGIGTKNLKMRVEDIEGSITIDSTIGQGTTIVIDVPYKTHQNDDDDDEIDEN